ncbi:hypothetical protein B0H14DRAFT_295486 [Mycena olivaceomarginata]|nr:hypothetical protein B0H14DRAFT_295486 [Mycena olivaceomarginata]
MGSLCRTTSTPRNISVGSSARCRSSTSLCSLTGMATMTCSGSSGRKCPAYGPQRHGRDCAHYPQRSSRRCGACDVLRRHVPSPAILSSTASVRVSGRPGHGRRQVYSILRHKATLARLELHGCSGVAHGYFPRPWHAVFALFERSWMCCGILCSHLTATLSTRRTIIGVDTSGSTTRTPKPLGRVWMGPRSRAWWQWWHPDESVPTWTTTTSEAWRCNYPSSRRPQVCRTIFVCAYKDFDSTPTSVASRISRHATLYTYDHLAAPPALSELATVFDRLMRGMKLLSISDGSARRLRATPSPDAPPFLYAFDDGVSPGWFHALSTSSPYPPRLLLSRPRLRTARP